MPIPSLDPVVIVPGADIAVLVDGARADLKVLEHRLQETVASAVAAEQRCAQVTNADHLAGAAEIATALLAEVRQSRRSTRDAELAAARQAAVELIENTHRDVDTLAAVARAHLGDRIVDRARQTGEGRQATGRDPAIQPLTTAADPPVPERPPTVSETPGAASAFPVAPDSAFPQPPAFPLAGSRAVAAPLAFDPVLAGPAATGPSPAPVLPEAQPPAAATMGPVEVDLGAEAGVPPQAGAPPQPVAAPAPGVGGQGAEPQLGDDAAFGNFWESAPAPPARPRRTPPPIEIILPMIAILLVVCAALSWMG